MKLVWLLSIKFVQILYNHELSMMHKSNIEKTFLLKLKSALNPGVIKSRIKSIPIIIAILLVLFILTKLIYEILILR